MFIRQRKGPQRLSMRLSFQMKKLRPREVKGPPKVR